MLSCFGVGRRREDDVEALLPKYEDETALQRRLHQKMHSYQMLRAISMGFMPSNEQLIINLRTLLASDVLNPDNPDLSNSGRHLVRYSKQWLREFIELLNNKNSKDQIQDFIWFLSKARVSVDTESIARQAQKSRVKADTAAAYSSLQTVGNLLLTNSDFRLFLGDLNAIGRQVFADTAFSLSEVAENAGKKIEPGESDTKALTAPQADKKDPPSAEELEQPAVDVSRTVANGLAQTGEDALTSLKDNFSGDQKEVVLDRLKQAILKLRKRPDYSDSVSTLSLLIKRYALAYSRSVDQAMSAAQDEVHTNDELDRAASNFWSLFSSFGDAAEWDALREKLNKVMSHSEKDPEFESLMGDVGNSVQKMLMDPDFFESADQRIQELQKKSKEVGTESSLRQDIDELLVQTKRTFDSVLHDDDVSKLIATSQKLLSVVTDARALVNQELVNDAIKIFIPLFIDCIQYIPIPRLEVSTPDVDLLLENLIIEPGRTVNKSSFLPYKLRVETYNDLEIRKAKFRTTSSVTSLVTIKLDGLSFRADEIGYWLRLHSGIFRLADEGIASFELDSRGIDIHVDVEIGQEKLEKILTLKDVRVTVHHFSYTLRKSKFSWLAWLLKPVMRPIFRKTMEYQLSHAIADFFHAANRELLYARERLRATRIADPQDLRKFVQAVLARLTPDDDPDVYTAVGVTPSGKDVFRGVYAPGSVVKLWEEEARQAAERVEDFELDGWRNEVFDVHTMLMGQ